MIWFLCNLLWRPQQGKTNPNSKGKKITQSHTKAKLKQISTWEVKKVLPCPKPASIRLSQGWIVTHGEERDSQQGRVVFPICDEEDPSCSGDGNADREHPQEAQEGLTAQAVLHGAGQGGRGQDQHEAHQDLASGQDAGLMKVSPEAKRCQRVQLKVLVLILELPQKLTELILPLLPYEVLSGRTIGLEVVGDLNGSGWLDPLVFAVWYFHYPAQLVSNKTVPPILENRKRGDFSYQKDAHSKEQFLILSEEAQGMQREVVVVVELMWAERRVGISVLIFWSYVGNPAGLTGIKTVERASQSHTRLASCEKTHTFGFPKCSHSVHFLL